MIVDAVSEAGEIKRKRLVLQIQHSSPVSEGKLKELADLQSSISSVFQLPFPAPRSIVTRAQSLQNSKLEATSVHVFLRCEAISAETPPSHRSRLGLIPRGIGQPIGDRSEDARRPRRAGSRYRDSLVERPVGKQRWVPVIIERVHDNSLVSRDRRRTRSVSCIRPRRNRRVQPGR